MFPGIVTDSRHAVQQEALPVLTDAMAQAGIDEPREIAAFLTTLSYESWIKYNQRQLNDTRPYGGRGLIQLTGIDNYQAAGDYLGIDLVNQPDLALELDHSVAIAIWYWTVARPHMNEWAREGKMGFVNAGVGYPLKTNPDGTTNDDARCASFAKAVRYLDPTDLIVPLCDRKV